MKIQRYILFIIISLIPLILKSQDYCDFILKIQNYQDSVKFKQEGDFSTIDSNSFTIDTYLGYFNEIRVQKNYKIGLYYFKSLIGGNPFLYAIKENTEIKNTDKMSIYRFVNKPKHRAKNHIIPDDSGKGFLQYLFFSVMGEQFALKWHSYYSEKYVIYSNDKLIEVINMLSDSEDFYVDLEELEKLNQISPQILIRKNEKDFLITWIENRTHSGIFRCTYQIKRSKPYPISLISEEKLLNIGLAFIY